MRASAVGRAATALALLGALSCSDATAPTPPASILLTTNSIALALGASYTIEPVVFDARQTNITSRTTLSWSSSNPAIASVDEHGVVTGRALGGPATITMSAGDVSAVLSLRVTPARIAITPEFSAVELNSTTQLSAVAYDYFGNPIDVGAITWTTSAPEIAAVGATSGVLTASALGDFQVSATASNYTSSLTAFVGRATVYDGTYGGSDVKFTVHIEITLGRVTRFTSTTQPFGGCTIAVNAALSLTLSATTSFNFNTPTGQVTGNFNDISAPTAVHGIVTGAAQSCGGGGGTLVTYVAQRL